MRSIPAIWRVPVRRRTSSPRSLGFPRSRTSGCASALSGLGRPHRARNPGTFRGRSSPAGAPERVTGPRTPSPSMPLPIVFVRSSTTRSPSCHTNETALIVAHGGSIRVIHALAHGLDYVRDHRAIPGVPNCAVLDMRLGAGNWRARRNSCTFPDRSGIANVSLPRHRRGRGQRSMGAAAPSLSGHPEIRPTPLAALADPEMPTERHFVRNHFHIPQADAAAWTLAIDGAVERPLSFSLDDLLRIAGQDPEAATLECAGHRRAEFSSRPRAVCSGELARCRRPAGRACRSRISSTEPESRRGRLRLCSRAPTAASTAPPTAKCRSHARSRWHARSTTMCSSPSR